MLLCIYSHMWLCLQNFVKLCLFILALNSLFFFFSSYVWFSLFFLSPHEGFLSCSHSNLFNLRTVYTWQWVGLFLKFYNLQIPLQLVFLAFSSLFLYWKKLMCVFYRVPQSGFYCILMILFNRILHSWISCKLAGSYRDVPDSCVIFISYISYFRPRFSHFPRSPGFFLWEVAFLHHVGSRDSCYYWISHYF